MLEKFKKDIQGNQPIKINEDRKTCRIVVTDKYLCEDLKRLGCVNKKSLILKYPKLREDLNRHFIRGYFDGDGCFSVKRRIKPNRVNETMNAEMNIIGTEDMLKNIIEHTIHKPMKFYSAGNAFKIRLQSIFSIIEFSNYIYHDCDIFMERKHDKYIEILNYNYRYKNKLKAIV